MHRANIPLAREPRTLRWTRDEYYKVAETGVFDGRRVQLIEGEILEMSPQGSPHAMVIGLVDNVVRLAFGPGHGFRVQLPLSLTADSEPGPDVAVVPGSPRDYPDGHPSTALLVVEVADTSLALDSTRKASLYAAAGVPEYWIVSLAEVCLVVHRGPAVGQRFERGAGYEEVRRLGRSDTISPLAAAGSIIQVRDMLP